MAAALLRRRLQRIEVTADIRTAGLLEPDQPVSEGTVRALAARRLDVSGHRSQRLDAERVRSATLLVGMERRHVQEAVVLVPEAWPRAFTLKELVRRGQRLGYASMSCSRPGWAECTSAVAARTSLGPATTTSTTPTGVPMTPSASQPPSSTTSSPVSWIWPGVTRWASPL